MHTPEIIADYQCHNAEVPLWHPLEQRLYWTDIPRGLMFRYDPATGESEQIYSGETVGGYTIQKDGSLILFKTRGTIERWKEGEITPIIPEIPNERDSRFNDTLADPMGRVFCGTMPTKEHLGRLYRLGPNGTLQTILEGIDVSNGMGFNPNRTQFYYTESNKRTIYLFDYNAATGDLSNQQIFLTLPENEGVPDGLTVDAEGYIWSARWNGGALFRYSPKGEEVLRIPLPAKKVSSVTFGGADYADIYITTAGGDNRAEEGEGAGAVFRVNLGIQGMAEFLSHIKSG